MYSVDIIALYKERRYKHILALIDGLPAHSRYVQALYQDEEFSQMLDNSEESGPSAPPLSTWTPEVDMLAKAVDQLNVLTQTLIGVNGGKPKKVQPVTRPLTTPGTPTEFSEDQQSVLDMFSSSD